MEKNHLDILFVNGVEFNKAAVKETVCLGQLSLYQVVKPYYQADIYDFKNMVNAGEIILNGSVEDRLETITKAILDRNPKIVSFYTMLNGFLGSVFVAKELKRKVPELNIVFGGPQATIVAEKAMKTYPFIDFIAKGEGEKTILPLLDALIHNKSYEQIPGLCYRKCGKFTANPEQPKIPEEELKNYLVKDYYRLRLDTENKMPVEGGRGCPYNCSFCSTCTFWGREFRLIEPEELVKHFYYLSERYGKKTFSIMHDLFTLDKKRLKEFCKLMAKTDFDWYCSSRVDILDAEMIRTLKEGHCVKIYFGIETGSPRMQKLIHKNLNLEKALENIKACTKAGIEVTVSMIYGYPEETMEDFKQTVRFFDRAIQEGAKSVQMHILMFTSGTEEAEKGEKIWYYDPDKIDPSIMNYIADSKEGEREIREHPDMYSHYYTIDTEVKERYGKIHMFGYSLFPATIEYIANTTGLLAFYDKNREIIEKHAKAKAEADKEGIVYEGIMDMYLEIADTSDDQVLSELIYYEVQGYKGEKHDSDVNISEM